MQEKELDVEAIANVFIEFEVLKASDNQDIKRELDVLIYAGKLIYVWSKLETIQNMINYCDTKVIFKDDIKEWKLSEFIFDILNKTSENYQKVDFIIDNNETFINKFKTRGLQGLLINKFPGI